MKLKLTNALALSKKHASFQIPNEASRKSVPIGKMAKICANGERFWVMVLLNDDGKYSGRVANLLLVMEGLHGLQLGDVVRFDARNIYDIQS